MKALAPDQKRVAYQFMLDPLDMEFLDFMKNHKKKNKSALVRSALQTSLDYQYWLAIRYDASRDYQGWLKKQKSERRK